MASKNGLHGRLLSRAQALQLLFQAEAAGRPVARVLDDEYVVTQGPVDDYAANLAVACAERTEALDRVLASVAKNWSVRRMAAVDRNILRIALYEILFEDSVAVPVAIDEAVRLARVFGGEDSYLFVNGVLGRVARDLDAGNDLAAVAEGVAAVATPELEAQALDAAVADDPAAVEAAGDVEGE